MVNRAITTVLHWMIILCKFSLQTCTSITKERCFCFRCISNSFISRFFLFTFFVHKNGLTNSINRFIMVFVITYSVSVPGWRSLLVLKKKTFTPKGYRSFKIVENAVIGPIKYDNASIFVSCLHNVAFFQRILPLKSLFLSWYFDELNSADSVSLKLA